MEDEHPAVVGHLKNNASGYYSLYKGENEMRKTKLLVKKITALSMSIMAVFSIIPSEVLSSIDLSSVFSSFITTVSAVGNSNDSEYTAPACSFTDELYDGSDAIAPLPSYNEYKEQTGYTEPLRISFTDFRTACGEGLGFKLGTANKYMADGYKLMLCNAQELYNYSMIVNSGSPEEISFYLSANIVLGTNIEYSEMSRDAYYFKPIGNDNNAFTGTFDGQNFEIRDLYFDSSYQPVTVGFFGVVGEGAEVKNFGIFHPTIITTSNNSTCPAVIASRNYGIIDSVYAIAQEYRDPAETATLNVVSSSYPKYAAGLVAINYSSGVLSNSYFAGMLNAANPSAQNPVCASNSEGGIILNCYYDNEVFAYGFSGDTITEVEGEITGLTNIDLKKVGYSENGMTGTKFKPSIAITDSINYTSNNTRYNWLYPRLYGFSGTGTADNPYMISTPADLIYFPTSYEYASRVKKYFQLANCIDMNEVAPNAYKPQLISSLTTNNFTGGKWVQYTYYPNNAGYNTVNTAFYGTLSGAVHEGDNCSICHAVNRGNDAHGNPLQECHAILNLTIDTPAVNQSGRTISHYSALIARTNFSKTITATVSDLNFIGGEISSGTMDCMPLTYNSGAYNLRIGTVIGISNYSDLKNVHSSATVRIGSGKCYSVTAGGLVGGYCFHNVTDCTNSGNIIGGYINMVDAGYQSANFHIGGLLGSAGASSTLDAAVIGKLTHVANYGNVYGTVIVAEKDSGWTLTSGKCIAAGIATGNIAASNTGNVTATTLYPSYYLDDSCRADRIANFGMIFDGPITLDENGKPVFDEDGKPQALPLDENKEVVSNNSTLFDSYIYGIGANIISHAYNEANIYSVTVARTHIAGIGAMTTAAGIVAGTTQYYNFLNYNKGNIYMYAGASEAHGISDTYANKCYNAGNIYVLGGIINSKSSVSAVSNDGGCFTGISGYDSKGCYNDGEIYLAPSGRSIYKNAGSANIAVAAAGVSARYSSDLSETDSDGNTRTLPSINAGKITVDLDKYNFDPSLNTTGTTYGYFPYFSMEGTGLGSYNENYGGLNFVPNTNDESNMIRLNISPCGGFFGNNRSKSVDHTRNYADISVDNSTVKGSLYSLGVIGLGYVSYNTSYTMSNCVNFGDISFKGYLGSGGLSIYTIGGGTTKITNCLNLGDVTVDPSSEIDGGITIRSIYTDNSISNLPADFDSIMNGWYNGCEIPQGLKSDEFKKIFDSLDKSKRYGNIYVSATLKGNLYITGIDSHNNTYIKELSDIINNGTITLEDLYIKGTTTVRGLAFRNLSNSKNYAPITLDQVFAGSTVYISGAAPGSNNLNDAPITVTRTVGSAASTNIYIAGITSGASTANYCENRGEINVRDCYSATVKGVDYASPLLGTSATKCYSNYYIGGIGAYSNAKSSINFADINVSDVTKYLIGGVCSDPYSTISDSHNYGNITCTNCSGASQLGGIAGYTDSSDTIQNCFNFGKLSVIDPCSYVTAGNHYLYLGGICGYSGSTKNLSTSVNCGELVYNNSKGENTSNSLYNTRTNGNYHLCVGGIAGYKAGNNSINNSLNYADINVRNELNIHVNAGGVIGRSRFATTNDSISTNLVNYGNVTVPDANSSRGQYIYAGGILGASESTGNAVIKYGINYGTVRSGTEKAANTSIGSILGRSINSNAKFTIDKFVDLSDPPEGVTYYPMMGSYNGSSTNNNGGASVNYTKNQQSIDDTTVAVGTRFATVKPVTLDKQENGGLFSADFVFRSDLIHEISEAITHEDNGMVYQDYEFLSPYLQKYMVSRFGEEIKNYGAYVVLCNYRTSDSYMPGHLSSDDDDNGYHPGLAGSFENKELVDDIDINPIYSQMVPANERSASTDYYTYIQQIKKSSLAELNDVGVSTSIEYANSDTSHFQTFHEYQSLVETHEAYDNNGNVSDKVTYTDIDFYIAIDSIDPHRAKRKKLDENGQPVKDENGDDVYETFDPGGYIYINQNFVNCSLGSTVQLYNGDTVDTTQRKTALNHYTDNYPDPWLTCDNLESELADNSENWSAATPWSNTTKQWEMAIPYQDSNDTKYVYTKVMGVFTAEDGVHKNIVVAHVVIDHYNPFMELDSITLQTPSDGTKTSTVDNGLLTYVSGMPSLTDYYTNDDGTTTPKKDVTYFYLVDDGLTGENIQKYDYQSTKTHPTISLITQNMDSSFSISCIIKRQDRLPQDGTKYNDLEWNPDGPIEDDDNDGEDTKITIYPTDITYDDEQKSFGVANFQLSQYMYYAGLYRIDLYYERTKSSGSAKHYASVFIAKQHSPRNVVSNLVWWGGYSPSIYNPYQTLVSQTSWDETHPEVDDMQLGLYAYIKGGYSYAIPPTYYYSRLANDCLDGKNTNYASGNGLYYSLKSYLGVSNDSTVYIDTANPIYNDSEVKGRAVTLKNSIQSIDVFSDEGTGAYYPRIYHKAMDIMAENGDIRRYDHQFVQFGTYGENDEKNYNNAPKITQTSATKDGYAIAVSDDESHHGIVYGYETNDVTFSCTWASANVTLHANGNSPIKDEMHANDGFGKNKVNIFLTPTGSNTARKLSSEEISEYFKSISCTTVNVWTFVLKNTAPTGTYNIIPYMTYTMDLSSTPDPITLYDDATGEVLSTSQDNIFTWSIPYSTPFIIENRPNDDSYLTQFDTSNDKCTPFIIEDSNLAGSDNRSVSIRTASTNQEIVYTGYDDVKTGDNRVDKFDIYSYVAKESQNSSIRMKLPYRATVTKWVGDSSPFELPSSGNWEEMIPTSSGDDCNEYNLNLSYNALKDDGEYTYEPSVTYYKVTAEDGSTSTIYTVHVVPGVRNKETTLEIAQNSEVINGEASFKESMTKLFAESDAIYQEILAKNGYLSATIKELSGDTVDVYQTKIFDALTSGETQPYIYNLKSFAFDISVDLPAGYTYDILLFSTAMDYCTELKDSQNGFSGKQLILSNSDDQQLHLRIVLKRAKSSTIWGVQHIWNYFNTNADSNGKILNNNGGYFYNYVYNRDEIQG